MMQIYYFSTSTCGPCKMFKPVVQEVQRELGVHINYIDATLNPALTEQYNISAVPTIIVERNGKVTGKWTGVMSKSQLSQFLS